MGHLSQVIPPDAVKKLFVPVLTALSQDPVANIRMNVGKTIQKILPHVKGSGELEEKLKQMLRDLAKD